MLLLLVRLDYHAGNDVDESDLVQFDWVLPDDDSGTTSVNGRTDRGRRGRST